MVGLGKGRAAQALRVAYAAERGDLVETDLAPAAAEAAAAALDGARADAGRVGKYLARYREVRPARVAPRAGLASHARRRRAPRSGRPAPRHAALSLVAPRWVLLDSDGRLLKLIYKLADTLRVGRLVLSPAPQVQSKRAGMEAALAADATDAGAADALDDGASEVGRFTACGTIEC